MSEFINNSAIIRNEEGDLLARSLKGVTTNRAYLRGDLEEKLKFSHCGYGNNFYQTVMRVPRISGVDDRIPIMISDNIVPREVLCQMEKGEFLEVEGSFRSYDKYVTPEKSHLCLHLYVSAINGEGSEEQRMQRKNFIFLDGIICKQPIFKYTPSGKQILECMVAVNRRYGGGRTDYIPCIIWGTLAKRLSEELRSYSEICFWGRMQSRNYIKRLESREEERITREVSVMRVVEK